MGVIRVELIGGCSDGEVRDVPVGTRALTSTQKYVAPDGSARDLVTRYVVTDETNTMGHRVARPDGPPVLKDKET